MGAPIMTAEQALGTRPTAPARRNAAGLPDPLITTTAETL
jgi:hypothetical protein